MREDLIKSKEYIARMEEVYRTNLPIEELKNKSFLISGSTGLIGSFLIDCLIYGNINHDLNCHIYAITRNVEKARAMFGYYKSSNLSFINVDVNEGFDIESEKIDYVLHLASNVQPLLYSTKPIETIMTNILGTKNMLDIAVKHNAEKFLFASSSEIYGENRGDVEKFNEEYCGYINSNTLRANYNESKRCGETLCQAYKAEKGLYVVIPRFTRTYGPTMNINDTKASSQFIMKAVNNEDIVLKSEGKQLYSYCYISDAISALLAVLLKGENGEAYNIAGKDSDITLKDLAELCASYSGKRVIFELPDNIEKAGYSTATKVLFDIEKIKKIGWEPSISIDEGIHETIKLIQKQL